MTFEKALTAKPEFSGVSGHMVGETSANAANGLGVAGAAWLPIESAPKDKYFLAVIDAGETERRLLQQLGLADDLADYREIHIAYRRKGDPKRKIRTSPHGRIYTATHWMNLPELPEN